MCWGRGSPGWNLVAVPPDTHLEPQLCSDLYRVDVAVAVELADDRLAELPLAASDLGVFSPHKRICVICDLTDVLSQPNLVPGGVGFRKEQRWGFQACAGVY